MNQKQLELFLSVARNHSFTKAAAECFLTQAAVTQHIQSLEKELGTELIDRRARPIRLTEAGTLFASEAIGILDRMNTAVRRTQEAGKGLVGSLRIGYEKGYEHSELLGKLRLFHRRYPNILLSCYRAEVNELAAGLINNSYDIIITWDGTCQNANPDTESYMIERVPLYVAVYAGHPFAERTSLKRSDLKNERLLIFTTSSDGKSAGDAYYDSMYMEAGYYPNNLFHSSDIESILMMVAAEQGISIVPFYCTKQHIAADNLMFIPLVGEKEYADIQAIWTANDSIVLNLFLDYLHKSGKTNDTLS
jgi:DNA-binding transcriptional LysR family regulator